MGTSKKALLGLFTFASTITAAANAAVIYVRAAATGANNGTSWTHAYTNLQTALGAAQAGDQIWVAAGVYRPAASSATPGASFVLPGNVALYGGFDGTEGSLEDRDPIANVTQLSGDLDATSVDSYHVLRATGVANARLDGFHVISGFANGTGTDRLGAGLIMTGGSLSIANCTFRNNLAYSGPTGAAQHGGDGGAIHCSAGAQLAISNCRFEANAAGNGSPGGLIWTGGNGGTGGAIYSTASALVITGCTFVNNTSGTGGDGGDNHNGGTGGNGGAVVVITGTTAISDSTFQSNHTGQGGINRQDSQTANIGGLGAAISIRGDMIPAATISNCTFDGNACTGRLAGGGALHLAMAATSVLGCTFRNNSAGEGEFGGHGGAIYAHHEYLEKPAAVEIADCLFVGNRAGNGRNFGLRHGYGGWGGAIAATQGVTLSIHSCNFQNNSAGDSQTNNLNSGGPEGGSGGAVVMGLSRTEAGMPQSIRNCKFANNLSGRYGTGNFGRGGNGGAVAVHTPAGGIEIANSLFYANEARPGPFPGDGGAIWLQYSGVLTNLTIVGNTCASTTGGGGLWLGFPTNAVISNCILWQNTAAGGSAEQRQIKGFNAGDLINYSCVEGWSGAFGGVGNIGSDPLFFNPPANEFRLTVGSPCIDAASNLLAVSGNTEDLYGDPRFFDNPATIDTGVGPPPIIDMGVFEFSGANPCPADLDQDGSVGLSDLTRLLSNFGRVGNALPQDGDLDGDLDVDLADLTFVLASFGLSC